MDFDPSQLQHPPETNESPITSEWLVSYVANGYADETQHRPPLAFIDWIRTGKASLLHQRIKRIRERKADGDKAGVTNAKLKLPAVIWSGTFRKKSKPMTDQLIEHSGLICADLDQLGEKLPQLRSALTKSPNVWAVFTSPSGDGLKCIFRVEADASKHYGSFLSVQKYCKAVHDVEVDVKCSDVGRLCFLSYDPDVYLNESAETLRPIPIEGGKPKDYAELSEAEATRRREIADRIFEDIDWEDDTTGFCECPGEHLHSVHNGTLLKIYLDKIPTANCFHTSCKQLLGAPNYQLRSLIAKNPVNESATLIQLSSVEMKPVIFIDKPLFQANAFHLLAGKKNAGKGVFLSSVAAQFTRGEFGENRRNVIWLAVGEDSLSIDVRPRIEAAGGDASRIFCATLPPRLPEAVDSLRKWIEEIGNVGLVVLDPISGMMPGGKESNSDVDVRAILTPLNGLADEGTLIVGVRHLKKDLSQGALAAVLGSVEWVNVPRAVIGIVADNEEGCENIRHVQVLTGNRCETGTTSRAFRIAGVENIVPGGEPIAKAEFLEGAGKNVEDIIQAQKKPSNREEAKEAILDVLRQRESIPVNELDAEVNRRTGVSNATLGKAKTELKEEGQINFERVHDEKGKFIRWDVSRGIVWKTERTGGRYKVFAEVAA